MLEHARAHAVLDVLAGALLEHDAVDVACRQQVGEDETGRAGADDHDVGLPLVGFGHGRHTSFSASRAATATGSQTDENGGA